MSNKKPKSSDEKIVDYLREAEKELGDIEEDIGIEIPKQTEFYKMPVRWGNIPTDENPTGCTKDDKTGKISYKKIYPLIYLPFQQTEVIPLGHKDLEPNRLIWGDNLHIMRMLPSESIDLIYIDPPFFSGRQYNLVFGDSNEVRSFNDIWEGGMPGYLTWLNARLVEMWRLLKKRGSIYVHLDWHASHYVKCEMDKIFGYDNFQNEIVWCYREAINSKKRWNRKHDVILFYTKGDEWTFNPDEVLMPHSENTIKKYKYKDEKGNYRLMGRGIVGSPIKSQRDVSSEWEKKSPDLVYRHYLREGTLPVDYWNIDIINQAAKERIGYPTQKPEALLQRILLASTKPGDVVADFFCGGGTTPTVAQKLGRRWIASDISRIAVAVSRDRLLMATKGNSKETQQSLEKTPSISIENWGIYEVPNLVKKSDEDFRKFILLAYNARLATIKGLIHGYGTGEIPIYIGSASQEKSITKEEVISFAKEIVTKKGADKGIMIGWGFSPSAQKAVNELSIKGTKIELVKINLIPIESKAFREHITTKNPQYGNLLKFIVPPQVNISSKKIDIKTYEFDVSESVSLNPSGRIINVQWDFSYNGERFISTLGYAFSGFKNEKPTLKAEYEFSKYGNHKIACKVQDSEGGESIEVFNLEVK